ncbi:MAG: hypothetical protein AB8G17_03945 [Gammaproteobacteria bacterium]
MRIILVGLLGLGAVAFGIYALQEDPANSSPVATPASKRSPAIGLDDTEAATTDDRGTAERAFQKAPADEPHIVTDASSIHDEPTSTPAPKRPRSNATDSDEPSDDGAVTEAQFVFEEVDLQTVDAQLQSQYADEEHQRYRFAKIDGEALRERIRNASDNDTLSLELFPGDIIVSRQVDGTRSRASGDNDLASWHGNIEGNPCSALSIFVDPQGVITLSSYHNRIGIFSVEITSQESVYAITQSTALNDTPCNE